MTRIHPVFIVLALGTLYAAHEWAEAHERYLLARFECSQAAQQTNPRLSDAEAWAACEVLP